MDTIGIVTMVKSTAMDTISYNTMDTIIITVVKSNAMASLIIMDVLTIFFNAASSITLPLHLEIYHMTYN
jgi:hypothetical protein